MTNTLTLPKFLLAQILLLSAGLTNAYADNSLTEQEKMLGCVKPKTEQHFDLVECLNKKNVAIVGSIFKTAGGDVPYALGMVDATGKLILPNDYVEIHYPREWAYDSSQQNLPDGLIMVVKSDTQHTNILSLGYLYGCGTTIWLGQSTRELCRAIGRV